jgi:hypothetical protein
MDGRTALGPALTVESSGVLRLRVDEIEALDFEDSPEAFRRWARESLPVFKRQVGRARSLGAVIRGRVLRAQVAFARPLGRTTPRARARRSQRRATRSRSSSGSRDDPSEPEPPGLAEPAEALA